MTGQSRIDETVLDEALAWKAALERDDADWDAYITWLEADPRHREAFNAMDVVDAAIDDHRSSIRNLLVAPPPVLRRWKRLPRAVPYLGGGIAAAVALFLATPALWTPPPVRTYAAEAGEERVFALADGIDVTLSPTSRIVVHGTDASRIELASGEAYFDVRHDPARMLTVSAGRYRISDVGTRFSVNSAGDALRVGVSEGAVAVSTPDGTRTIQVTAGHQLLSAGGNLRMSAVTASEIGSWRSGRLSYSEAPLSLVVADISRYSGKRIVIDPSLESAHFSGSLVIGDGSKLLAELAAAMDARIREEGDGARIGPAPNH